jgi:4-hydroxybenzoate polyprenyltransferase
MVNQLRYILKTMRPKQWAKNLFVFAALVFDGQLLRLNPFLITAYAFALFCLVSSLVYIINDLADIESDRQHPVKKNRPLASGKLTKKTAIITAAILFILIFPGAFIFNLYLGLILSVYFIMMIAYSFWLKHVPLIDVMIIAAGFVLRVAAGLVIIVTKRFSPWLFVATTFLALFIGLGKRRAEIQLLATNAGSHRRVLDGYSLDLLDQLLTVVLSATLMTYCLYTFSAEDTQGTFAMMLTIPFVIYGLFRYLYLIRIKKIGGAPEEIVLTDHPMQAAVGLWALTVVIILYLL